MSYAFLIDSIGADKYFQIAPELLSVEIRKQWPNVEIRTGLKEVIEWTLATPSNIAICEFHNNYETISVSGDLSLAVEVAAWYRRLVPNEYELFFYTGARLDKSIKLSPEITPKEIEHIFNSGQ